MVGGVLGEDEEAQDAPGPLIFDDTDHHCRTLQALNMMRKNRHFCDVILHVGNAELHAHRAVLASASSYLFEMFSSEEEAKGNARETVITYKLNGGFERSAIEKLIDYAYTAKLSAEPRQVKAIYLAASHLKMEPVVQECARHLMENLTVESCIDTRSLPGITRHKSLVSRVDSFIEEKFEAVRQTAPFLALTCLRIELIRQTRQEMTLDGGDSVCQLVLEWIRKQCETGTSDLDDLAEKDHMLYLAFDNSLQDCSDLPSGDSNDTEMVQDYKKMSKKITASKNTRRKAPLQPAKPRVLFLARDIGEQPEIDEKFESILIASCKVSESAFQALIAFGSRLVSMSVTLRLNQPTATTPSPIATTPVSNSRAESQEKEQQPDILCVMAHMSSVKCSSGCANLNEQLLVCGGYDRVECLKSVESYDPEWNIWATVAPMREARGRFNIAVVRGEVYAVGGSNGTTELDTVEKYSQETQKWTKVASLPLARSHTGVCNLGDKIYCIGGWNGQVGIRQCDVLDPDIGKWISMAALQTGRYQAGVCAMNGQVFAVGGCDAWNCLNSVEIYDPETDEWSFTSEMITARRGCGVAHFKGKLYVVGGSDGTHALSSTEIYDPETKTWTPGPNMTTPRANVGVAVIGSRLYAVGGFSGKAFLNSIEYLDEKTDEWTTFMPKGSSTSSSPFSSSPTPNGKSSLSHQFNFDGRANGVNGQDSTPKISEAEAQNGSNGVHEEEK
ncbi:influenza virus NS1A-binding protein homolog isoform X2 [Frankliniella occidentalis]|nr:influenza virus NS1A-binding protein homolog isoform X2 [Frankliniella occidentalis]